MSFAQVVSRAPSEPPPSHTLCSDCIHTNCSSDELAYEWKGEEGEEREGGEGERGRRKRRRVNVDISSRGRKRDRKVNTRTALFYIHTHNNTSMNIHMYVYRKKGEELTRRGKDVERDNHAPAGSMCAR